MSDNDNSTISSLQCELEAYSPCELAAFVESVSILLETADDGTLEYCVQHARIKSSLAEAVEARMVAERHAARGAEVIPLPGRPK